MGDGIRALSPILSLSKNAVVSILTSIIARLSATSSTVRCTIVARSLANLANLLTSSVVSWCGILALALPLPRPLNRTRSRLSASAVAAAVSSSVVSSSSSSSSSSSVIDVVSSSTVGVSSIGMCIIACGKVMTTTLTVVVLVIVNLW